MQQFAVAVERVIRAPRAKVYRAFLDPELLARWMGPDGSSVTVATVDERVGGEHKVEMIGPDGVHFTLRLDDPRARPGRADRHDLPVRRRSRGHAPDRHLPRRGGAAGRRCASSTSGSRSKAPSNTQSVDTGWSQTLAKLAAYFDKE